MKKLILMAVCLACGNIFMTAPALAAFQCDTYDYACQRVQAARTEYMKQEAELMKQRAKMLEKCNGLYPPSYCK